MFGRLMILSLAGLPNADAASNTDFGKEHKLFLPLRSPSLHNGAAWLSDCCAATELPLADKLMRFPMCQQVVFALTQVPLLASLNAAQRSELCTALKPRIFNAGESIVRKGEPGEAFYIVESGTCTVLGDSGQVTKTCLSSAVIHSAPCAGRLWPGDQNLSVLKYTQVCTVLGDAGQATEVC